MDATNYTLINPEDAEMFPQLYEVSLYNYGGMRYLTYNTDEQSALDSIVDYIEEELESEGKTAEEYHVFYSNEDAEILAAEDGKEFITAGNYCRNLDSEHTQVFEASDTAKAYAKLRVLEYNTGQAQREDGE